MFKVFNISIPFRVVSYYCNSISNSSSGSSLTILIKNGFHTSNIQSNSDKKTTVDADDVRMFQEHASSWWNTNSDGEFAALHSMNAVRVPWIRDSLVPQGGRVAKPLKGLRILDVGSGGGILSEPLARLGAQVTGLDASQAAIEVSSQRLIDQSELDITYLCKPVEDFRDSFDFNVDKKFDAVIASEIIEHVNFPSEFVAACSQLLKPHGSLFLTTMNRTKASYALAVVAAENFLHLAPPGTHDWNKFPTPEELAAMLKLNHMHVRSIEGLTINPVNMKWSWIDSHHVNYAVHAVKSL